MKRIGLVGLVMVCLQAAQAQTWDEWFKQNKTQRKYLLEQIAHLQVYIDHARKGYQLVQGGLQVIHRIKEGEFSLHQAFIASLSAINPSIAAYADVATMAQRQVRLYARYRDLVKQLRTTEGFTSEEIDLVYTALTELVRQAAQTLDESIKITTRQRLSLTDDERIKRITALKEQSLQQENHFQRMQHSVQQWAAQRMAEATDVERVRTWHGITR